MWLCKKRPCDHALVFSRALSQEIIALEDAQAIKGRKRAYNVQLLLEKTVLPAPAKELAAEHLQAPPPFRRHAPGKFTFVEKYQASAGKIWIWAPYTGEAWWEEV